jgi:peptidoglycan/xylan/chitin deacetylase (PgdA/CDA1 family)
MIRRWIKAGAAGVFSQTGMDKLVRKWSGSRRAPVVIGYHRVVEDFESSAADSIPSMLIGRQMLEHHLDWLSRRYRFVSLDELGARLEGRDSSGDAIAAVTFDDGYRDFYDHAFPLLKQKGVPAAVFVVSDLVGTTQVQTHDKLYLLLAKRFATSAASPGGLAESLQSIGIFRPDLDLDTPYQATRSLLEALPKAGLQKVISALESDTPVSDTNLKPFHSMTWEMLARIRRAGMTVGSHTRTHVLMPNERGRLLTEEVSGSRQEIEKHLGPGVQHFAYPGGNFNADSVDAVERAGYRFGYTVCGHRDPARPLLTVPRTLLWENSCWDSTRTFSGSILNCQIHGAFDFVSRCRQRHEVRQEREYAQR